MNLLILFWTFFKVGLFTLGGGYASLPLVQDTVVEGGYISYTEYIDFVAISEILPGPIALNVATFIGTKLGGFAGAAAATFGFIAPSLIIVMLLAVMYYKYRGLKIVDSVLKTLRPAVAAFVASAGITIAVYAVTGGENHPLTIGSVDMFAVFGVAAGIVVLRIKKLKVNPLIMMLAAGIAGGAYYYFAA